MVHKNLHRTHVEMLNLVWSIVLLVITRSITWSIRFGWFLMIMLLVM